MAMDAVQSKSSRRQTLLEACVVEAGLDAPVLAAADLVGEDDLKERRVVELLPASEGDAFGQCGSHGLQLEPL